MDKSILAIVDVQPDFQASSSLSWGWALAAAAAIVVLAVAWVSLNVPKVTGPQPRPLLNPSQPDIWHKIAFVSKVVEGESWMRYRFALPNSQPLGLPPGQHLEARIGSHGDTITRACFPCKTKEAEGAIWFLFKADPSAGAWEEAMQKLADGDTIDIKGPLGNWIYEPNFASGLGILTDASGIAAAYQLAKAIATNRADTTKVRILVQYDRVEQILLRAELNTLAAGHYGKFKFSVYIREPPERGFPHHIAEMSFDAIDRFINIKPVPGVKMLTCAEPEYNARLQGLLKRFGYEPEMRMEYTPKCNVVFAPDAPDLPDEEDPDEAARKEAAGYRLLMDRQAANPLDFVFGSG